MKILNFGSLNLDYVYRVPHFVQPGETIASLSREIICGGKGLNQSVAVSRSGAEIWHAGCIGRADGKPLEEMLIESGVHTDYLRKVNGPSGHTVIQVNDSGENSIILFQGANHRIDLKQVEETLDHFEEDDILMLQNEISCIGEIMEMAEARKMRIALNPSPIAGVEKYPLHLVRWLFVNEREATLLAGTSVNLEKAISEKFPRARSVITFGAKGAVAVGTGRERHWQDAFSVRATDTTAAGDTFEGYFLGCLAMGMSEQNCLRYAAKASSIAVQRKGAAPSIPGMAEVRVALQAEEE